MAGEADRRGSPVIPRSTLLVRRLAPSAAGLRTYARGRVCAAESCATVLSVYNGAAFCALHDCVMASRPRRALHPARERACDHCGTVFETVNAARRFCSDRCRMAAFARRKRAATRQARSA